MHISHVCARAVLVFILFQTLLKSTGILNRSVCHQWQVQTPTRTPTRTSSCCFISGNSFMLISSLWNTVWEHVTCEWKKSRKIMAFNYGKLAVDKTTGYQLKRVRFSFQKQFWRSNIYILAWLGTVLTQTTTIM